MSLKKQSAHNTYHTVLVIGNGGREHAIAWKLAQSDRVHKVYVAPGNAGTAREKYVYNVPLTEPEELIAFARREQISLTVVGPEAPLAAGWVDRFREAGLAIIGPTRAAAQLESSKDFAKAFMARHGIPSARYRTFYGAGDLPAAQAYVDAQYCPGTPIVLKADGLAAGKGVVLANTCEEAHVTLRAMLCDGLLGEAGTRVVIEEFLEGEEASCIVLTDGKHALAMASAQDHKRLCDGDQGPNTGGMGAYSPAPVVTPTVHARVMREIIRPTLAGMAQEGTPYTGFLYAGLMIAPDGIPRVVEFNCRLGDPEAQVVLARLKSDLLGLLEAAQRGQLDQIDAEWDRRTALGVVLAAEGYPATPRTGMTIHGADKLHPDEALHIFHAGTRPVDPASQAVVDARTRTTPDGSVQHSHHASAAGTDPNGSSLHPSPILSSGGRVLCVTALADRVQFARQRVYEAIEQIHFDGITYRRDIGHRALTRPVRGT